MGGNEGRERGRLTGWQELVQVSLPDEGRLCKFMSVSLCMQVDHSWNQFPFDTQHKTEIRFNWNVNSHNNIFRSCFIGIEYHQLTVLVCAEHTQHWWPQWGLNPTSVAFIFYIFTPMLDWTEFWDSIPLILAVFLSHALPVRLHCGNLAVCRVGPGILCSCSPAVCVFRLED